MTADPNRATGENRTRAELLNAFDAHQQRVALCVQTGDWNHYLGSFTHDVTYIEHAFGRFHGHEEVRSWILATMNSFPGNEMTGFPPKWTVVDEEKGWIITEVDNPMRDPGDGSRHATGNITILRYAGEGLFCEQEDVYNPLEFFAMSTAYVQACAEHGTLSADAAAWAAKYRVDV